MNNEQDKAPATTNLVYDLLVEAVQAMDLVRFLRALQQTARTEEQRAAATLVEECAVTGCVAALADLHDALDSITVEQDEADCSEGD